MCQFNIPFAGEGERLLSRAQEAIETAGGTFSGNAVEGVFRAKTPIGSIQGTYRLLGQQVVLAITKKPFLLSCARIEKELAAVMQ